MITIHAIMLVSLGFLCAVLLGLVIVPAYRRRVARLTRDEIKQAMPLTEAEIRADKDRLRADYAIVIHEIQSKLEKRSLAVARQRVEINRRDAVISGLEGEVSRMRTSLEEHENARRVLEHTIMDRLPKVEQRLLDARKLLTQRDREIAKLTTAATKQAQALEEATQINAQNRDEIHRLNAALTTRAARSREGMGDARFDGEVALRSEIEALRAKTRDQATLITRLQGLLGRAGGALGGPSPKAAGARRAADSAHAAAGNGSDGGKASGPLGVFRPEDEIARLQLDLSEAEAALRSVRSTADENQVDRANLENELRVIKAQSEDQSAEIAKLKAALTAYQDMESSERGIPDSKAAMQARISELTAVNEQNSATISRLRAEVAAGNEKLARQAMHYMEEMRRLGAGSMPMAMPKGAGGGVAGETTLRTGRPGADPRRPLSDRIADPRQRYAQDVQARTQREAVAANGTVSAESGTTSVSTSSRPAADNGSSAGATGADDVATKMSGAPARGGDGSRPDDVAVASKKKRAAAKEPRSRRRGGLIDRITRLDGSK